MIGTPASILGRFRTFNEGRIKNDMLPATTGTYDLGSASLLWADIRATTLYTTNVGSDLVPSAGNTYKCGDDTASKGWSRVALGLGSSDRLVFWRNAASDYYATVSGTNALRLQTTAVTLGTALEIGGNKLQGLQTKASDFSAGELGTSGIGLRTDGSNEEIQVNIGGSVFVVAVAAV